ncbi:GtrA family protein [Saccharibacillus sp. WB 17]|nr:GtrA family protein [Saccharibacillus sp. WB 17]
MWTKLTNKEFLRFLISGGLNTLATYIIYLILLNFLDYRVAYTISYVCGIFISYGLNVKFVFKTNVTFKSFIQFPIVYLVQYAINLLLLYVLVDYLYISEIIVPIISVIVTIPLSFLLSKFIIKTK